MLKLVFYYAASVGADLCVNDDPNLSDVVRRRQITSPMLGMLFNIYLLHFKVLCGIR